MQNLGNLALPSILIAIGGLLTTTVCGATVFPAMSGHAYRQADASCFNDNYGTITNTCTTTKNFEIPIPLDCNAHQLIFNFNGYAQSASNNLSCAMFNCSTRGTSTWGSGYCESSGYYSLTQFGVSQEIDVTQLGWSNPSCQYGYLFCQMGPNSRLNSVTFTG